MNALHLASGLRTPYFKVTKATLFFNGRGARERQTVRIAEEASIITRLIGNESFCLIPYRGKIIRSLWLTFFSSFGAENIN
jgi:hypothetical protein